MPEADVLELVALHPARPARRTVRPAAAATAGRQRLGDDHGAGRRRRTRRSRTRGGTRSPGSTGSSTASSSRSAPTRWRPASAGTRAASSAALLGAQRELDVDRRRRVVLVLDLRLGQRRAAVDAPVDRLLALVDEPLLDELARARARSPPGTGSPSSGTGRPSRRGRRAAGTRRS